MHNALRRQSGTIPDKKRPGRRPAIIFTVSWRGLAPPLITNQRWTLHRGDGLKWQEEL
jgi:hypothetical protein